jgi:acetyltransferase
MKCSGRVPARRRAARGQHFRIVRHGGSARQTAAPERPAPDHRHQRRRPGVLATDALITSGGAARRNFPKRWRLNKFLPADLEPQQSGGHHRRRQAGALRQGLEIAAKDPNTDGMLVILTPQAMTDPTAPPNAEAVTRTFRTSRARELDGRRTSWPKGEEILNAAEHPDLQISRHAAAKASTTCGVQRQPARALRNARLPPTTRRLANPTAKRPANHRRSPQKSGRTILTEFESKELLGCLRHPDGRDHIAKTESDAVKAAARKSASPSC